MRQVFHISSYLLTNRQVANPRNAFANHSSADIKLSKDSII